MSFREFFQRISLNPKYRILRHAEYLQKHMEIDEEHDKESFRRVLRNLRTSAKRMTIYQWTRNIVFVLLYISAILAIARDVAPWAAQMLRPIGEVANIFGFGVLTVVLVIFSKLINTVHTDMMIEHSHLVAIAIKHNDDFVVHPEYKWGIFKEYE